MRTGLTEREFHGWLSGGARRSIADAAAVVAAVEREPARMGELAALAVDPDPLVVMRVADALEKLLHSHPDCVHPHRRLFLGPLARSERWETRLQVVRALPLFDWTAAERRRAVELVLRNLDHTNTFVRTWAMDSLARFAERSPQLLPVLREQLALAGRRDRGALAARARAIRKRMQL